MIKIHFRLFISSLISRKYELLKQVKCVTLIELHCVGGSELLHPRQ